MDAYKKPGKPGGGSGSGGGSSGGSGSSGGNLPLEILLAHIIGFISAKRKAEKNLSQINLD